MRAWWILRLLLSIIRCHSYFSVMWAMVALMVIATAVMGLPDGWPMMSLCCSMVVVKFRCQFLCMLTKLAIVIVTIGTLALALS